MIFERWFQTQECAGGRNTLSALRRALEDEPQADSALTGGVYLLTTGLPDQHMDSVNSYVSERCGTVNLNLHVCLFTGEKHTDSQTESARALSDLAHAGHGRFIWTTDSGILESDDISVLIEEMQTAANYYQKSCELVDSLMQKSSRGGPGVSNSSSIRPQTSTPKTKLPSPRPTTLSLARQERGQKSRPNSSKAETPAVHSKSAQRRVSVSQSVFFMEDGHLGVVFKRYPKPKSVRKSIASIKLPKREGICSTKQWLKRFGIRNLHLDLHRLLSGPECCHQDTLVPSVQRRVSAKYCAIFPSVQINGAVKHLHLSPAELKQYISQTETLMLRYYQRLQWLLTGSRCMFGSVLEKEVCLLLDVSGSMASCFPELQKGLMVLIWDQLHANGVRFNMLAFSGGLCMWRPSLVQSSEDQCLQAVQWLSQINTHGSSSTLTALQTGCGLADGVGVYLVSDGRSDCSHSLILTEMETLRREKSFTVHTIALNCPDRSCSDFLKCLARKTGGRFHQAPESTDSDLIREQLLDPSRELNLPEFAGDDLRRLTEEIQKLRLFQKQAKAFRETILESKKQEGT